MTELCVFPVAEMFFKSHIREEPLTKRFLDDYLRLFLADRSRRHVSAFLRHTEDGGWVVAHEESQHFSELFKPRRESLLAKGTT